MRFRCILISLVWALAGLCSGQSDQKPPTKEVSALLMAGEKLPWPERLAAAQQAVDLATKLHDPTGLALGIFEVGRCSLQMRRWMDAQSAFAKCVDLFHSLKDSPGELLSLFNSVTSCLATLDHESAIMFANRALDLSQKIGDGRSEGISWNLKGVVHGARQEYREALEAYNRALKIRQDAKDQSSIAETQNNLGRLFTALGRFDDAKENLQASLNAYRGRSVSRTAGVLTNLGQLFRRRGDNSHALKVDNEAIPLYVQLGDNQGAANLLLDMGLIQRESGEPKLAIETFKRAQEIWHKQNEADREAGALLNEGLAWRDLGREDKALDIFERSKRTFEQVGDIGGIGRAELDMGNVYTDLGQYIRAKETFESAMSHAQASKDQEGAANAILAIGSLSLLQSQPAQALEYFTKASLMFEKCASPRGLALAKGDIGLAQGDLGNEQAAIASLEKTLDAMLDEDNRSDEAITLANLGLAYFDLGDPTAALKNLHSALWIAEQIGDRKLQGAVLADIGWVLSKQNQPTAAILFLKQSVNVYQSLRSGLQTLDGTMQRSYRDLEADKYRLLADLLIRQGRVLEAERVLEFLKSEERFEFLRGETTPNTLAEKVELKGREEGWATKWSSIKDHALQVGATLRERKIQYQKNPSEESKAALQRANKDQDIVDEEMAAFYAALASEADLQKKEAAKLQEKELQEFHKITRPIDRIEKFAKGSRVAAIYSVSLTDATHFIVATSEGATPITVPVNLTAVNTAVVELRRALTQPTLDPTGPGKRLYDLVFKSLIDKLKEAGINRTMWCLDGSLRFVPIAALWNGSHYLLEDDAFTIFSPLQTDKLAERQESNPKIAAFGASKGRNLDAWRLDAIGEMSIFGIDPEALEDAPTFEPLPNSKVEIQSVVHNPSKHADGVVDGDPWIDGEFTSDVLLSQIANPDYAIAHIASHFKLSGDLSKSYLLTGSGDLLALSTFLSLNGPSLAEMAQKKLPLSALDLMVLSACDTAIPTHPSLRNGTGAESESFASVVLDLGVSSVIASLWSVSDKSTSILMRRFYENWVHKHMSKSDALRQAQLSLLHGTANAPDYSHPFYWGPFLLYGNWL